MPFEEFVWLLWSVKESVYKYLKRIVPGLVFSPTKIFIHGIDPPYRQALKSFGGIQWENNKSESSEELFKGVIICGSDIFYSRSKIHDELISTVVSNDKNFENTIWGIKSIVAECETIFTTLMGEDVEARRKFIEENALDVKNLDI